MPDVRCSCGKKYRVPDHLAGRKMRCKACGATIAVRSAATAPPSDEPDLSGIPDDPPSDYPVGRDPIPVNASRYVRPAPPTAGEKILKFFVSPKGIGTVVGIVVLCFVIWGVTKVVYAVGGKVSEMQAEAKRAAAQKAAEEAALLAAEDKMFKVALEVTSSGHPSGADPTEETRKNVINALRGRKIAVRAGSPTVIRVSYGVSGARPEIFRKFGSDSRDIPVQLLDIRIDCTATNGQGNTIWQKTSYAKYDPGMGTMNITGDVQEYFNKEAWKYAGRTFPELPPLEVLSPPAKVLPSTPARRN